MCLSATAVLASCTPTILPDVAQAAFEDRITEDQITDTKISSGLLSRLVNKDKNLALDIGIDVWEQRLLLTGTVDSQDTLDQVLALARMDSRITSLYNEIRIVSTLERDQRRQQAETRDSGEKSGIGQTVNDYWLEAKIKAKLIATKGITSVNYRWRSIKNAIYIIGRARSSHELDIVLAVIAETDGVKNIKHFIEVKPPS